MSMMFLHVSHTPGDHPYIPPFNPFLLQAAELLLHGRADVGAKSMDGQAPWMDDVFFEFLKDFFPWELGISIFFCRLPECCNACSCRASISGDSEALDLKLMPKRNIQLCFDNDVNEKPQTTSTKQMYKWNHLNEGRVNHIVN